MSVVGSWWLGCVGNGTLPVDSDDSGGPPGTESTVTMPPADCPVDRVGRLLDPLTEPGADGEQLGASLAAGPDGAWLAGGLAANGYDGRAVWWKGDERVILHGSAASTAGSSVAIGDIDGDGLMERIVGARSAEVGEARAGAVWVVPGDAGVIVDSDLAVVAERLDGASDGAWAGHAVALAGDADGDGLADLVIGVPLFGTVDIPEQGGVHRVTGGALGGLLADIAPLLPGKPQTDTGWTLAALDDGDGDGVGEVLVGAPYADPARVFVLADRTGANVEEAATAVLQAASADSTLGFGLDGGADLDGDGLADVVLGDPAAGRVFALDGDRTGEVAMTESFAVLTWPDAADAFGYHTVTGDFDCDGTVDVAVGAVGALDFAGRVSITWGPLSGEIAADAVSDVFDGTDASGLLGYALAAGDGDGDGLVDLAASAPLGADGAGLIYVF